MPTKKALPVTRPPLARMMCIHEDLKAGRLPNATLLSKRLETSTKTINRDIAFMRDQMGLPIGWDPQSNGYHYTSHVDGFPSMQFSESELFALLVALKALKPYRGTPFHAPLESALRKLSDSLKDKVFISLDRLDTPVSFKSAGLSKAGLETLQIVTRAVTQQAELHFEYKNPGARHWLKRKVQPWHLCYVENQCYVICWDLARKAKRTFALVRMRHLEMSGNTFQKPKDFDIQKYLEDSFGIIVGDTKHKVRVEFDEWAAQLIKEKEWHPAQEIEELQDDRIELRIELADLFEIERWILSWGSHAKVLAPAQLKKRIRKHAASILEN